ncbi:uncharacterized protein LOC126898527 [Daktulosphaira vitifoliae]|uniref:uncharacterized protein LOC126898527 n=1 Tax=Daktulosphaira vitifoliae TaxID=58002 RepID=UPI0021AA2363|nr:uncharacterized protein LOC126898527 [Daktulosphaira vitifoliae]
MSNNNNNNNPANPLSVEEVQRLVGQLAGRVGLPTDPIPRVLRSAEDASRAPLPEVLRNPVARAHYERGVRAGREEVRREIQIALNSLPRASPSAPGVQAPPSPKPRRVINVASQHFSRPGEASTSNTRVVPSPRPLLSFRATRPDSAPPTSRRPKHPYARGSGGSAATPTPTTSKTPRYYSPSERERRTKKYKEYMLRRWGVVVGGDLTPPINPTSTTPTTTTAPPTTATTPTTSAAAPAVTTAIVSRPSGMYVDGVLAASTPAQEEQPETPMELEDDGLVREMDLFLSCPTSPAQPEPPAE